MATLRPSAWVFAPIALILWPLVARDFSLRRRGLRPDRMYWADELMLRLGWTVVF